MTVRRVFAALGVVGLMGLTQAAAAAPSMAGPSVVKKSESADFAGRGYAPNAAVSIAILAPNGAESHSSSVTKADGSLAHRITPTVNGHYQIKVLDSGGRTLSSAMLIVMD